MDYTRDQLDADRQIRQRALELSSGGLAPSFDAQTTKWAASTRWAEQRVAQIDELLALLDAADEVEQSGS